MDSALKKFRINLGRRIKQLREEKALDQSELAAIINKDKQVINRYEKQGANPTAYILLLLAKALNVTTDDLLNFSELENIS